MIVFAAIFGGATLLWTIQILTTVWGSAPASALGCQRGTELLYRALFRARAASPAEGSEDNERVALARYRTALLPEWAEQRAIEAACQGDEPGLSRLRDVVALRYAEEHAVRYESLGLAPLRRRLKAHAEPGH